MNRATPGQVGYDAYGETANWKTFDGRPMPTWDDLGKSPVGMETQRRWGIAAQAILALILITPDPPK